MLALYRSERQAASLAVYQEARAAFVDGLGVEPSPKLRALQRAVLEQDPALDGPPRFKRVPQLANRRSRRKRWVACVVLAALGAALGSAALLLRRDQSALTAPPNSVAVIDTHTNRVVAAIPVGIRPGAIAAGLGSIWVGNRDDQTLSRIDLESRRVVRAISLGATPTGVAVGSHAVWVARGRVGQLSRIDPTFNRVTRTVDLAGRALYFPYGSVAVGEGAVWAVFGNSTLVRIDPTAVRKTGSTLAGEGSTSIVARYGSVWVSNSGDSTVLRYHPATFDVGLLRTYTVGRTPTAIAAGAGAIWVANMGDDTVTRIDPGSGGARQIDVGRSPVAVAVGADAVWVANRGGGTVSRIDPRTDEVARTIVVGGAPSSLVVAHGAVWVSVQEP